MRNKLISATVLTLACYSALVQNTQPAPNDARTQNSGAQRIPQDSHPLTQNPSAADTATPSNVTRRDQRYMWDLARANEAEIIAGQLAQTRAADADVKELAKQMVDDHTTTLGKLNTLAQKKQVVLPQDLTKDQSKMLQKIRLASGPEFDKTYVDLAAHQAHIEMLDLLKKIQDSGHDGDLKMLSQELQPIVEAHLKKAREISSREMSERR